MTTRPNVDMFGMEKQSNSHPRYPNAKNGNISSGKLVVIMPLQLNYDKRNNSGTKSL